MTGVFNKPIIGFRESRYSGFAVGLLLGVLGLPIKSSIGMLDLVAKLSEGCKNWLSLRADSRRQRYQMPLVVQRDGLVRPFNEDVSNSFHLLSICKQLQNPESEFYNTHHRIDTEAPDGSIQERVLLITTSRVVFGTLEPKLKVRACRGRAKSGTALVRLAITFPHSIAVSARNARTPSHSALKDAPLSSPASSFPVCEQVSFEIKLERMMRVDMPKPYDKIIIWTWQQLPRVFARRQSRFGEYSRPNTIIEREIRGINPQQLKEAMVVLKHLAQQQEDVSLQHMVRTRRNSNSTQGQGLQPQTGGRRNSSLSA